MIKLNFRRGSAFASSKAKKYLESIDPQDIKKITVIRHAAIGDMVVMRPVLIEMRKYFPNAHITLSIVENYSYGAPVDLVDSVHILSKRKQDGSKTSLFERIEQIKKLEDQEIIFDMADTSASLMVNLFTKAKLKIGFTYRGFKRIFYDISTLRSDFVLETESMMHQLNILGAKTQYFPYDYRLSNKRMDKENPYIIYFAGASIKNKCWNENNFIELLKKTVVEYPEYKHVILKGIKDDEQFNDIYKPFEKYENVIHQDALPLDQIYDYLAQATLLVSADTGIRNMAIATNTPTVGIMLAYGAAPFRYYPRLPIHEIVFNTDLTQPSVEKVYETFVGLEKWLCFNLKNTSK